MVKKKAKEMLVYKPAKEYAPAPHPQQARIDAIRDIPSLITANPQFTPKGK